MKYGLIGEHLGHSFSPMIHEALGNGDYILKEIPREEIDSFFRNRDFRGINVTIPYKKIAYSACDELSARAKKAGAVNCVINRDGILYGDNTDCAGIEATLKYEGINVSGKTVLILGKGGAASAVRTVIDSLGGIPITVYRRQTEGCILPEDAARLYPETSVIINATPAGMFPEVDGQAIDLSGFSSLEFVFDLVYNPLKTDLIMQAESLSIPCSDGLRMLVVQGVRAHELFTDTVVPDTITDAIVSRLRLKQSSFVLIGMSSCGKSTLGKKLAQITGRKFVDLDEEIIQEAGMNIPEIFRLEGEEGFRKRETMAARTAGLECGTVISCGGGIIERSENFRMLKRNGILIFIDRDPNLLITDDEDRPMLKQGFSSLFQRRLPVYREWADMTLRNDGTPEEGLSALLELLAEPVLPAGKDIQE